MKHWTGLLAGAVVLLATAALPSDPPQVVNKGEKVVLVIHGGAGIADAVKKSPKVEKLFRDTLREALAAGHAVLKKKEGTSLDAVETTIKVLEDSGVFNAGKGAVFTREGRNELDASIMDGATKEAGAVAGVSRIRNPISAARLVMKKSGHVLMIGDGADRFAASEKLEPVSPLYFHSDGRWKDLMDAKEEAEKKVKESGALDVPRPHFGTVGCVALDRAGNLAAGTSTGGLTWKRGGRVGDSPLIGAGTYADNKTCAVSCTGYGEIFIRHAVAYDVTARMKYLKLGVREATEKVLADLPKPKDGAGGIIALNAKGDFAMTYDTDGMYRGYVTEDGQIQVMIWDK